jgi:hypothetical protein
MSAPCGHIWFQIRMQKRLSYEEPSCHVRGAGHDRGMASQARQQSFLPVQLCMLCRCTRKAGKATMQEISVITCFRLLRGKPDSSGQQSPGRQARSSHWSTKTSKLGTRQASLARIAIQRKQNYHPRRSGLLTACVVQ